MYDVWTQSWWPRHKTGSIVVGNALVVGSTTTPTGSSVTAARMVMLGAAVGAMLVASSGMPARSEVTVSVGDVVTFNSEPYTVAQICGNSVDLAQGPSK